ncbi:MAG: hypothetical protein WBA23_13840 [Tunicatimonas sp.]|uniref:hypothetical protein n=1 Tax=Tunicatimonas sp. TaxID=1940096 RepID=UPI003C74DD5B
MVGNSSNASDYLPDRSFIPVLTIAKYWGVLPPIGMVEAEPLEYLPYAFYITSIKASVAVHPI